MNKSISITHSGANFLNKEAVAKHKSKYFVTLEEHEALFREKEVFRQEYEKIIDIAEEKDDKL